VGKVIVVLIIGLGAALYFPDSRQSILDKAMPVVTPVLVWSAKKEMREIQRQVSTYRSATYKLPARREWVPFLDRYFAGDAARDPWGTMYQFYAWRDSFAIISYGPDLERSTPDDIRTVEDLRR
jgi:hypothetical protein